MRTTMLALFLALPFVSSCAVAGVAAGVVVSQEVLDNNTYVSHIERDVSFVWPEVKIYLSEASLDLIEVDESSAPSRRASTAPTCWLPSRPGTWTARSSASRPRSSASTTARSRA